MNHKKQTMNLPKLGNKYALCGFSRITKKRVIWELTSACTRSCEYCFIRSKYYQERKKHLTPLKLEQISKAIDKLKFLGYGDVQLTGGELFLRSDAFQIIEKLDKSGFTIALSTNADRLSKKDINQILKYNVRSLNLSLDSHDPKINDAIRGAGAFKNTVRAIKFISHKPIRLRLHTVITDKNRKDIDKTVAFLYKLGVRLHTISSELPNIETYNYDLSSKLAQAKQKYPAMEIDLLRIKTEPNQKPHSWLGCNNGANLIGIYPDGTIIPCTLFLKPPKKMVNIYSADLPIIKKYLTQINKNKNHLKHPCILTGV